MSFEAKGFAHCTSPNTQDEAGDVEVTYTTAFANSIAESVSLSKKSQLFSFPANCLEYVQVSERFDALETGLGSISKDPDYFYRDVWKETKMLIEIDDIVGEMGMIKRVLQNQTDVINTFRLAISGEEEGGSRPRLEAFSRLESDAKRVRSMVNISQSCRTATQTPF